MGTALLTRQGRRTPVAVPDRGSPVDALLEAIDGIPQVGAGATVVVTGPQGTEMGTGQTVVRPGDQVTVVDQVRGG